MDTLVESKGRRPSKRATALTLAQGHLRVDPYLESVFLLEPLDENDPNNPIKLLEVVDGTLEGDALPIGFPANPKRGIMYPFQIIEISPREFRSISGGKLQVGDYLLTIGEQLGAK